MVAGRQGLNVEAFSTDTVCADFEGECCERVTGLQLCGWHCFRLLDFRKHKGVKILQQLQATLQAGRVLQNAK